MTKSVFQVCELTVQGFRCFDYVELHLDPFLTVLVANNGEGKTALLEALCVALGPYIRAFDEGKDYPIDLSDIRMIRSSTEDNTMEIVEGGASVEAKASMGQGRYGEIGQDIGDYHWW